MSRPVQWKTVRYWSREYENFGLCSLKVFGLGLVKQTVYILVHLLKDSQISRMQSTTNFDFIIFRNMTLFLIKHLYILSIHKGSSMKACIQPVLSACAPLRALSILSHPAAISHASNPLPTRNLLAICTERNWWWKPHVLISLPAFVSRCCVVWRPHSEPDCRRWGRQSGLLRHRCFRRLAGFSLDELNHYVLGLEEEIFRRKSGLREHLQRIEKYSFVRSPSDSHWLLTRIGVDHEKIQRGRPRSGRYPKTRHLSQRLGPRWIWRHHRFQQILMGILMRLSHGLIVWSWRNCVA